MNLQIKEDMEQSSERPVLYKIFFFLIKYL